MFTLTFFQVFIWAQFLKKIEYLILKYSSSPKHVCLWAGCCFSCISEEHATGKNKQCLLWYSCTCCSHREQVQVHIFLQICKMRNNVGKVRMTQLTAYVFVAIPISLGGKYTSVDCMRDRYHVCFQTFFWCSKEYWTHFGVMGFLCNNFPITERLNGVFLWAFLKVKKLNQQSLTLTDWAIFCM